MCQKAVWWADDCRGEGTMRFVYGEEVGIQQKEAPNLKGKRFFIIFKTSMEEDS